VSERRRAGSREARFAARFPAESAIFRIATLEQELALVAGLNRSMGRRVGVYPEIKHPHWHRAHGVDLSRLLIDKLHAHGYRDADAAAFVQCFDAAELRRVRDELDCKLKLVQLVGAEPEYASLLSGEGLARVAGYADALGPSYAQLLAIDESNGAVRQSELAREARRAGLALHPYTFRRDELPGYVTSFDELLSLFIGQVGIDGLFCDQPDIAVAVRERLARRSS
jgi:glycerophosphoryl diester phosphodiesterase